MITDAGKGESTAVVSVSKTSTVADAINVI
jgi:hypothetical protein